MLIVIIKVLIVVFVRQTLAAAMVAVLVLLFLLGDRMTVPQVRTADIFDDIAER